MLNLLDGRMNFVFLIVYGYGHFHHVGISRTEDINATEHLVETENNKH